MKIKHLELKKLEIPFRVAFKHSSAERNITEAVIAIAHSDTDIKGYGEGCPRHYVTGETIESCMSFLEENITEILQIDSIGALKSFVSANYLIIDKSPAGWCAIETSLLDLFGKLEKKSLESLLSIPEIQGTFQYTAVLGVSNTKIFHAQLAQYLQIGFTDYKIKISGNADVDIGNISAIRDNIPNATIRLDANNLWNNSDEAEKHLSTFKRNFWAIEEPIKPSDYAGMEKLAKQLSCKIILDESFLNIRQLSFIKNNPEIWIPNIRISKMGGLLRSLAIAAGCRKHNIKFIIGAQVGETSILSRMALSLANSYRDLVLAQEGAFGTYLLEYDVIDKPIIFGKNGVVILNTENESGLGVKWTL